MSEVPEAPGHHDDPDRQPDEQAHEPQRHRGADQRAETEADAVVFGHSHIPLHERDPATGFQIFNPGSPTDRRRHPVHTMGEAVAEGGALTFALVDLGR